MSQLTWKQIIGIMAAGLLLAGLIGCSDSETVDPNNPVMQLSQTSLAFTTFAGENPDPARQTVKVSNIGGGYMTFTAEKTASWLTLDTFDSDTVYATVLSISLAPGNYYDTITVSSPQAINSPLKIAVSLEVVDHFQVSPSRLNFEAVSGGVNPASGLLAVTSVGGGAVTYTATTDAVWINLDNATGTAPDTINVEVDASAFSGGIYEDSIIVISPEIPDKRITVPVSLTVSSWTLLLLDTLYAGQRFSLRDLTMLDAATGWATGFVANATQTFGVSFKTVDSGNSWTLTLVPDVRFGGVAFTDAATGWVAIDSARLMYTWDGGSTWNFKDDLPLDSTHTLRNIAFVGPDSGWAVGTKGTVVRTTDGGITWTEQTTPTSFFSLTDLCMVDYTHGWICGNRGTILHTDDAGNTWTEQTSGTTADLQAIAFVDSDNGWAVGEDGTILHTGNGGITWSTQSSGVTEALFGCSFVSTTHGWAVGANGMVVHTSDGGQIWRIQAVDADRNLFAVVFTDQNNGLAVGDNGVVAKTISGGF